MKQIAGFLAAILICVLSQTASGDNIFVTIDGVQGGVALKGHEKTTQATGFSLDLIAPTTPTGLAGKVRTTF